MDLPCNAAFTVEEFVRMQEKHIAKQSTALQGKKTFTLLTSLDMHLSITITAQSSSRFSLPIFKLLFIIASLCIIFYFLFFSGKNLEIEFAVRDLLKTISSYKLEAHVEEVNEDDMAKLKKVTDFLCTSIMCVCTLHLE